METGLTIFRAFLGLCSIVLMALFMWGLKSGLYYMGREFAVGFASGMIFLFVLLVLHHKMTGKTIFTED
jgi:hypothetical protein